MAEELDKVDIVTVGVGWTGGIIASELTKAGHNVVGLERGAHQNQQDFLQTKDELRFDSRYELLQNLSKETLTFRNTPDMTALPMREFGAFHLGTNLGGSGVHWSGVTWRFLPYDFEIYSETIDKYGEGKIPDDMPLQDWGITYEELEPYYDKFEQTAGISGEENPFGGFRSNPYPTPPMKTTPALRLFRDTTEDMGYQPFMAPSANLSENYTNPDGQTVNQCQFCSFCSRYGCDFGAKSDPINTVIPTAMDTGNFDLRTHCNVIEILHEDDEVTGVRYVDLNTGREYDQPADVVVLTSYVLNNVRLLLQSELGEPYDPEEETGVIGKNYCYQVEFDGHAFFDKEYNMQMGAGALGMAIDDFNGDNFDHDDLDFLHGGWISLRQGGRTPISSNTVPEGTPSFGREFKEQSIYYFYRMLEVGTQGASLPNRYNYLDLDPTYTDELGNPLLRMTFNFHEQDQNLARYLAERIEEILQEMGGENISVDKELGDFDVEPYQSTHNTGGVIMGDDPETSAVNNYLQMWDYDNLFVVGASAFAHNGGYNPTGTVGALAYRAAEGIEEYLNNGEQLVENKKKRHIV